MLLGRYPIFQYAYFVNDIDEAAHKWHRLFGAGPFFAARQRPRSNCFSSTMINLQSTATLSRILHQFAE